MLRRGEKTEPLQRGEAVINALQAVLFTIMAVTPGLFRTVTERRAESGINIQAPAVIGFRLIFIIVALASLGETISWIAKKAQRPRSRCCCRKSW